MPSIAQHSSGPSSDAGTSIQSSSALSAATSASPFGLPLDPAQLKGTVLTSPHVLISAAAYGLSNRIFTYAAPGADALLDSSAQLWKTFQRKNSNGVVPELSRLQVRSGASNVILGYLNAAKTESPISVFVPGSALSYMASALSSAKASNVQLPLAFQVAALNYDADSSSLVPDYTGPLSVAKTLSYSVITPSNALEGQHFTILSLALAKINYPVFNLYDGPSFTRTSGTIYDVLDSNKVTEVYDALVGSFSTKLTASNVSPITKMTLALEELNSVLGTSYKPFEYTGHEQPHTVFVTYGSSESTLLADLVNKLVSTAGVPIGAVSIKVPLPFDSASFSASIPDSTRTIVVISQSLNEVSSLKADVSAALFMERGFGNCPTVADFTYHPSTVIDSTKLESVIAAYVVIPQQDTSAAYSGSKFAFWSSDSSKFVELPSKLAHTLSLVPELTVKYRAKYDNIAEAGVLYAEVNVGKTPSDKANVAIVGSSTLFNVFDIAESVKENSTIIVISESKLEDVEKFTESLPIPFKRSLASKNIKLQIVDLETIGEEEATQGRTPSIAIQVAFWQAAYPALTIADIVIRVLQFFGSEAELLAVVINTLVTKILETGIKSVAVSPEWVSLKQEPKEGEEEVAEEVQLPSQVVETAFAANPREADVADGTSVSSKFELAKKLVFKESYQTTNSLRPDLPVRNFVVKVQENRRLTPAEYDRNIFHIEFDITGTGLTYDIGEALGVHGRNNPELVEEFIKFYGINGDDLVEVVSRDDSSIVETRTIRQAFIENLDLLGKPPKRFYEGLATFATDDKDKAELEKIASAEGAAILKKYQDEEFYSYADIFELYPSARPSAEDLVQLIAPLKRREYSIASSQKMHNNAVHLLIVVVDWVDKRGRYRFGHCSRYLSQLAIGSELVVSVKPSVMKLPPLTTQPIVMAGLGTGLAPFKAFVEERIVQKQQGHDIGEIYLYMGSRHRKEEYLYGELWEAYLDAGIMTHVGAAFSRDQPEKIYIQDKIRSDLEELTDAITTKNGSFYLCGPTWPVPDITACLEDILTNDAARRNTKVDAAHEVEEMKESGRYVLEVY